MWIVDQFDAIPVELDMSSSGQGRRRVTRIAAAGVTLVNAVELIDGQSAAVQVHICEACGIDGCATGNWVALRRLGARVVWIPDWDALLTQGGPAGEHTPPAFFQARGAPVFDADCWTRLRALSADLPPASALAPLDSRDAALLAQWGAPGAVLGAWSDPPQLRRERLVAVTDGELDAAAEAVDTCLLASCREPRPLSEPAEGVAVRPIEFWLDVPGTPAWAAFVRAGRHVGYVFGDIPLFMTPGYDPSQ